MEESKERLARLEETMFFQERLLGELNDALTRQQRQIDLLEGQVKTLLLRLEEVQNQLEAGPANVPPPHYL